MNVPEISSVPVPLTDEDLSLLKPSFSRADLIELGQAIGILDEDGLRIKAGVTKKEQIQLGAEAKAMKPGPPASAVKADLKRPFERTEHLETKPFRNHEGLAALRDSLATDRRNVPSNQQRKNRKNK